MNYKEFREELVKIMPGYSWTVHRKIDKETKRLSATGIQSAGLNRTSTLRVIRWETNKGIIYEAKSSGFGRRSRWLSVHEDKTLARALRGLQDHYEYMARLYSGHASALEFARKKHHPIKDDD